MEGWGGWRCGLNSGLSACVPKASDKWAKGGWASGLVNGGTLSKRMLVIELYLFYGVLIYDTTIQSCIQGNYWSSKFQQLIAGSCGRSDCGSLPLGD